MALNFLSSCLHLPSTGLQGVHPLWAVLEVELSLVKLLSKHSLPGELHSLALQEPNSLERSASQEWRVVEPLHHTQSTEQSLPTGSSALTHGAKAGTWPEQDNQPFQMP